MFWQDRARATILWWHTLIVCRPTLALPGLQNLHLVCSGRIEPKHISWSCTNNFLPWPVNPQWPACEMWKSSKLLVGIVTTVCCSLLLQWYFAYERWNSSLYTALPWWKWFQFQLTSLGSSFYYKGLLITDFIGFNRMVASVYGHITAKCKYHWLIWFSCVRHPLQFCCCWRRKNHGAPGNFEFYILSATLIISLWRKCFRRKVS